MVNVFITVDTEFWPRRTYAHGSDYVPDFRRDIHGATRKGDFGLSYQIDMLNAHGLRAVFFVEGLCAYAVGMEPVAETVRIVQQSGHDVQLHLHTEWLDVMTESLLPGRSGLHIRHFSEDEQTLLIEKALASLKESGAENVCAFRAGNYGANFDTLRALARNGIHYDTSHNTCYLDSACDMQTDDLLLHPQEMFGVTEFPVTFFRDFRGRNRPLQLTACSAAETEHALRQAAERGWPSVVIVSHSFELIRGRSASNGSVKPDHFVIRRFERLCRFLQRNQDAFRTATFADLPAMKDCADPDCRPLRGRIGDTSVRLAEQFARRVLR